MKESNEAMVAKVEARNSPGSVKNLGCVLVIDDEPLVRWSVAETLADAGYDVIEADDGASAIQVCSACARPDVVLLDLSLPDSTDLGLLASLRRLSPGTPIVIIT